MCIFHRIIILPSLRDCLAIITPSDDEVHDNGFLMMLLIGCISVMMRNGDCNWLYFCGHEKSVSMNLVITGRYYSETPPFDHHMIVMFLHMHVHLHAWSAKGSRKIMFQQEKQMQPKKAVINNINVYRYGSVSTTMTSFSNIYSKRFISYLGHFSTDFKV